jgi:hypothetical protein
MVLPESIKNTWSSPWYRFSLTEQDTGTFSWKWAWDREISCNHSPVRWPIKSTLDLLNSDVRGWLTAPTSYKMIEQRCHGILCSINKKRQPVHYYTRSI